VTDRQVVIHWDGTTWTSAPKPAGAQLFNLWGTAPNDLWGTSGSSIYHWNGSEWQLVTAAGGPFGSVWGPNPNTLWAVSSSGYILHLQR
jgi:hypothetical protein